MGDKLVMVVRVEMRVVLFVVRVVPFVIRVAFWGVIIVELRIMGGVMVE